MFSKSPLLLSVIALLSLTACGTVTGIPSHGGGKRYAVEQELIASSARAAVKKLDLSSLKGRKVALRMVTIGDQGAGNLMGGRYSIDGLLRGEFVNTPTQRTTNEYPVVNTTTTTSGGGFDSVTVAQNALNAPSSSITKTDGTVSSMGGGIRYQGLGSYENSTLITNTGDTTYLLNLLQTYFYLQGIEIVDPEHADTAVFISVDVFGTIRSRDDWHLFNQENLIARTSLEMMALDTKTGNVILSPHSTSYEAHYSEKYALWTGPYTTDITVEATPPLPVTFSDIISERKNIAPISLSETPQTPSENNVLAQDPKTVEALKKQD